MAGAGDLPLRTIPGGYGWPVLGAFSDRLNYFWLQGPYEFFRKRMEQNQSTVFRTNMPPSFPLFWNVNPKVVAVVDCNSFSHLFDMEVVEKRNILIGDFMPSLNFTGNTRVCAYLDTSETQHAKLKRFVLDILKRSSKPWLRWLESELVTMWDTIDAAIAKEGSVKFSGPLCKFLFHFLSKAIAGADPSTSPPVSQHGYAMLDRWLALQLLPALTIGVIQPLEEMFLHSWAYPFFLVRRDYNKVYKFIESESIEVIERGKSEFGLSHEETIHNLLFILGFNAYGGLKVFLTSLMTTIINDTTGLQQKLRKEVKDKLGDHGSLNFESVKELELTMSVVYETLRMDPPVPIQYGRARKDFKLRSHDSTFHIKKGELLCGYQKLVMRDPKVLDEPDTFKPERFMKNKELLSFLFWSNGPETGSASQGNKQCAGKEFVPLTACMFLAHMFQRYDSVVGTSSSITALRKAT